MSLREEQCKKVCRILDDVLANRPTERDSLIVAVRKAFKALAEPPRIRGDNMTKREFLDTVFALAPNEANAIMDAFDEYVESNEPPAQPEQHGTNLAEVGTDLISRAEAIDALRKMQTYKMFSGDDMLLIDQAGAQTELMMLPPAQPERIIHCKDCEWWTKQECSPQGRCALSGMYPTGGWFCGNARMREVTT